MVAFAVAVAFALNGEMIYCWICLKMIREKKKSGKTWLGMFRVFMALMYGFCLARVFIFMFVGAVLATLLATERYAPEMWETVAKSIKVHCYFVIGAIIGFVWWSLDKGARNNKDNLFRLRKAMQKRNR